MMVRKIIIGAVVLVVIVILVGLYKYYQPQKDYASSKPDFVVTADELFNAFEQDETAANEKFVAKNSTIQVSGVLSEVVYEADSTISIILKSPNNSDVSIYCGLASKDPEAVKSLQAGSNVSVKGQCTGFQGLIDKSVYMIRGAVVE
jgi:hypothetical protein